MSFIVHTAGTQSLMVDEGRPRSRGLGLPVGGASDRLAFALGNALVGNPTNTPALEIALAGPTLEATDQHALVVFGAPFALHVNDGPRDVGKTFTVRRGDLLTIGTTRTRLRAYVCVPGGFDSKEVMGSRSALAPIRDGQTLNCPPSFLRTRWLESDAAVDEDLAHLRVLPGSHAGELAPGDPLGDPLADFWNEDYMIKPESNRMGLRLAGRPLTHRTAQGGEGERLSAPVCPGTVQVTHDGLPIVLGVDAQTIGGYPRAAHVICADLDKLAQLRPGDRVRFQPVELARATALFHERRARQREWVARLLNSRF